jgi:hypothetical protein
LVFEKLNVGNSEFFKLFNLIYGFFKKYFFMNSFSLKVRLPNTRLQDNPQKSACKYIKISHWTNAQIMH